MINQPYSLNLDLGNISKMTNNLIKTSLGGIHINDFQVFEISCILVSPQNFAARTHPMLQNVTKSNVVEKQSESYLISTLSTASALDTLDHWLIDSEASRHFIGYKYTLSNVVENKTNLKIILGDNATYPGKEQVPSLFT